MRLDERSCRERMAAVRVVRLATASSDLWPHLVPVTFVLRRDHLFTAVDQKPKTTTRLRRLRNIAENPRVSVLADHYEDDWERLWWVRADGLASIVDSGSAREAAIAMLSRKYSQYRQDPPRGPVVDVEVSSWTGWAY